jgi:hypothetical protein
MILAIPRRTQQARVAASNDEFQKASLTRITKGEDQAMAKYGKKARSEVKKAMRKRKKGTLKTGKSRKKVTGRTQAVAIGLSNARKKGAKVPAKKRWADGPSSPPDPRADDDEC